MFKLKQSLAAFIGLSLLIVLVALVTATRTQGQGGNKVTDVNVVNTPLPVTGTVAATQDGAWAVGITGTPTVGIASSANTVKVDTTNPLPVRDVDNPARQPFQAHASGNQAEGTNVSTVKVATVPAGKRLVIEFVSAVGQVPQGQHVVAFQITTIAPPFGGQTHDLLVNEQPNFVNGDALFRASQQVRLYANPGSTLGDDVRASFWRDSSAGEANFGVTISGYLVNVP